MALTPRLDLRQSQSLVMTPQLQQAIKLLQFSNMELREYVETQLEQNPLLEADESSDAFESKDAQPDAEPVRASGEPMSLDVAVGDEAVGFGDDHLDLEMPDNVF